eukprot:scaffold280578_cov30-Tisochrysis_lutea.AAC.3
MNTIPLPRGSRCCSRRAAWALGPAGGCSLDRPSTPKRAYLRVLSVAHERCLLTVTHTHHGIELHAASPVRHCLDSQRTMHEQEGSSRQVREPEWIDLRAAGGPARGGAQPGVAGREQLEGVERKRALLLRDRPSALSYAKRGGWGGRGGRGGGVRARR